jgi:hypothetical protein
MIDFSNFEKISDEAYVWRNFLGEGLADDLFKESEALSNGDTREDRSDRVQLLHGEVDQRAVDMTTKFFKDSGFQIGKFLHWYNPPHVWFPIHRDEEAFDPTPLKKSWGGVLYLAEMEGGELFYPTNNTWFKPHKGDFVLHTASIIHGATEVSTDNKRFITFVVYDESQPIDPQDRLSDHEGAAFTFRAVHESKDWMESDIAKKWMAYNQKMSTSSEHAYGE